MRQALILKQEQPKASLEEAAVVFSGLVTRVRMLFMRHHCINILWGQCCCVIMRPLLQEQPTAAMEDAGVAVFQPLTWFMYVYVF